MMQLMVRIGAAWGLLLTLLAGGCAHDLQAGHHGSPATQASASPPSLPQPPVGAILGYLANQGITEAGHAPVFVLSHWLMYRGPEDATNLDRPKFEGSPFAHEGAKFFLAIGPVYSKFPRKAAPPPEDLVIASTDEEGQPTGATFVLAGQQWSVGFSMKNGSPKLQEEISARVWEWLKAYAATTYKPSSDLK